MSNLFRIIVEELDERERYIVFYLLSGPLRYNELYRKVSKVMSRETFNKRLRSLLKKKIIVAKEDPRHKQAKLFMLNPRLSPLNRILEKKAVDTVIYLDTLFQGLVLTYIVGEKDKEAAAKIFLENISEHLFRIYVEHVRFVYTLSKLHLKGLSKENIQALTMIYRIFLKETLLYSTELLMKMLPKLVDKVSVNVFEKEKDRIRKVIYRNLLEVKKQLSGKNLEIIEEAVGKLLREKVIEREDANRFLKRMEIIRESKTPEECYDKLFNYYKAFLVG